MKRFIVVLWLFATLPCFSQKSFVKGFIVDLKGDTLYGLINDKDWEMNPDRVEFSAAGKSVFYQPQEIRWFGTDNSYYRGAILKVDKSNFTPPKVFQYDGDIIVTDTVFLRVVLINPNISLYRLKERNKKMHFFIDYRGQLSELLVKYKRAGDAMAIQNLFRQQLKAIAPEGCPVKFDGIRYETSGLVRAIEAINQCAGSGSTFQKKAEKIVPQLSIVAGASLTDMEPSGGPYAFVQDFRSSLDPAFGAGVNFVLPGRNGKTSVYTDLIYKSYSASDDRYKIELTYAKLSVFYRYTFKKDIFIQGGLTSAHALSASVKNYNQELAVRKLEVGIAASVGAKLVRNIGAQIRFERSSGMSTYISAKTPTQSLYLLLSYTFH
jgi:hypothetical protein